MAIVQNPFTGRTSGKFAGAVFAKQFGKNTMRSKPVEVRNPRSTKQKSQRLIFAMMVALSRPLIILLRVSFKQMATGMSAFNAFVQQNIKEIITGVYPDFTYDFSKLVIAKGTLAPVVGASATAAADHKITLSWTDDTTPGEDNENDVILFAIINEKTLESVTNTGVILRSAGTTEIIVPVSWALAPAACYISAANGELTKIADSIYLGSETILA